MTEYDTSIPFEMISNPMCHRKDQSEIIQADEVTQAEVKLQKHEILHLALECIKAGVTPTIAGKQINNDKNSSN